MRLAFERAREPAMKSDDPPARVSASSAAFTSTPTIAASSRSTSIDLGNCDFIGYQAGLGTVGNNFIGTAPRQPVVGLALVSVIEAVNRGDADVLWLSTGPGLLTRSLASYLAGGVAERLAATCILERHELMRAVAIHCASSYKLTERQLRRVFRQTSGQKIGEPAAQREAAG